MFEDSTFESAGKLKTKSKYWMIATLILNASVVAVLIVYPLIHPEALPLQAMATLLNAPAPPPPPPPPPPPQVKVVQVHVQSMQDQLAAPSKIPHVIKMVKDDQQPPPTASGVQGMSGLGGSAGGVIGGILGGMSNGPVVKAAPPKKIVVSSGVMASKSIYAPSPTYPPIARAARISGTVVLAATIGKDGTIKNLRVVNGPPMLQQSALDAVRRWRYKPTILDGVEVDVDTTISVVFSLNE